MPELSRRRFLQAAGLLPLAAALPRGLLARAFAAPASQPYVFFDTHEGAVIVEATARLIPGPDDDPLEAGHPGAREANVVRYIDTLLGAFAFSTPRIFAGGPYSDRKGGDENYMADFIPLSAVQEQQWRARIAELQKRYRDGINALDGAAGGDFTKATPDQQDQALNGVPGFRDLLFQHAIEGFLSAPEYGGNANAVGWQEIRFPGDSQPRGYTPDEVSRQELDPLPLDVLGASFMEQLEVAMHAAIARRTRGR
jgi:Gluconate 2-dehydrogenase subunit 3